MPGLPSPDICTWWENLPFVLWPWWKETKGPFTQSVYNKKSRIYGTSDQSDLSIYICTFEADSLYIWGWFSIHLRPILYRFSIHLRLILYRFSIHLRQNLSDWLIHITLQNKLSLPQMYRESASNVLNSLSEPIRELYIWGWSVHFNENVQIL